MKVMNENINLLKILKDCPDGTEFWSPLYGVVQFCCLDEDRNRILTILKNNILMDFNSDATLTLHTIKSPDVMIYPSEDQRDWNKFTAPWYKKEKFDIKTLQPFDKILVRDDSNGKWVCTLFSHINDEPYTRFVCQASESAYIYVIPYNDDTKHLVGTTKEAPEYYRYWED